MELEDCAFPLLAGVTASYDPNVAFAGANIALLVGALPPRAGSLHLAELADLLCILG